jgi:hypothetical protein
VEYFKEIFGAWRVSGIQMHFTEATR